MVSSLAKLHGKLQPANHHKPHLGHKKSLLRPLLSKNTQSLDNIEIFMECWHRNMSDFMEKCLKFFDKEKETSWPNHFFTSKT